MRRSSLIRPLRALLLVVALAGSVTAAGGRAPQADLVTAVAVAGATDDDPIFPGGTFAYALTVGNDGPSEATDVIATATLPHGVDFVFSRGEGCTAAGRKVTCGPARVLAPGAAVSWDFTVRLRPSYAGTGADLALVATSGSRTADPEPGNDAARPVHPVVTAPQTSLSVTRDGPTITVSNGGPSTAAHASIEHPVPASWTCVATPGSSCGAASGEGTLHTTGTIAPGGTLTYTLSGTLEDTPAAVLTVTPPDGVTDTTCSPSCTASRADE
ncbi:DUF11 domain-containing protein [Streptomyces griseus]|uniref:DUF11 domain-containing protein n=1 Tax=Streptomyces griseus TaxID=1911 RepID=UPI00055F261E|nr:DUF11 domain-containing protein [Streptomyces griseus]